MPDVQSTDKSDFATRSDVDRVLDAARQRGDAWMCCTLAQPEMLGVDDAASRCGCSTSTINRWCREKRILVLNRPDVARSRRYPSWQFDATVFPEIRKIIATLASGSMWRVYAFLTRPEPLLAQSVPLDLIRGGRSGEVIHVARLIEDGGQGVLLVDGP